MPDTDYESDKSIELMSQGLSLSEWWEAETRGDDSTIIDFKDMFQLTVRSGNSDETIVPHSC